MSITGIILATVVVGGVGLIIGALLGIAEKVFNVPVDEQEIAIREMLPGNNCGGCGYAGCDAFAKAVASGAAKPNGCPVGGESTAKQIAGLLGVEVVVVKKIAFVKCAGDCQTTVQRYQYTGNNSCSQMMHITGGGDKACTYGCLGYGECVKVCEFDAIHIEKGIAVVDREKCTGCGKCQKACPKYLIEIVPYQAKHLVSCVSRDKGKDVKAVCQAGCIGCKICEKSCPVNAIVLKDNLAKINYGICKNCGVCKKKCPVKIIK